MQQHQLIVILADISGYTRFMLENQTSAVHGQLCINSLIEAILKQVDIPLVLQEIEGDAVFLYARHPGTEAGWHAMAREVSSKLDGFFSAFIAANAVSIESTPCSCAICRNGDQLGLKLVVHAGEAVFHEVAGRPQVSGPDVILAHRLLKNTVAVNEYVLLSDAAYRLMGAHLAGDFTAHDEHYEGFGTVGTRVRYHDREMLAARDAVYELSRAEREAAVDGYQEWVVQHLGSATLQQMRAPIRPFGPLERLRMAWDALVGYRWSRRSLRARILAEQETRGRRRHA